MDLSPAQRVLAFVAVVVVLGGMGAYLLIPGVRAAFGQGHHAPATPSRPASVPPSTPAPPPPAPSSPAGGSASPAATAPDIYQWLPFSRADLGQAAGVTEAFGAAYDTYSYRESAASYAASLHGLATSELGATLARAYSTPGVVSQRARQKQVSTARAVIDSLRSYGESSLTFVVTIDQSMRTSQGRSQQSAQWAITVVSNGGDWLANDIEPAQAGNS
jgi:hypothetical protein